MWNLVKTISWIKYIPLVLSIAAAGWYYLQSTNLEGEISEVVAQNIILESNNQVLRSRLEDMSQRNARQVSRVENLLRDTRVAQENNSRLKEELEGYKNREEIVVKKPSLIERRINDGVSKLMREYECTTGNTSCISGDN